MSQYNAETINKQKKRVEYELKKLVASLKKTGKDEKEIARNSIVRKLKAQIRDFINRLNALDKKHSVLEAVKTAKIESMKKGKLSGKEKRKLKKEALEEKPKKKKKKTKKKKNE